MEWHLKLPIEGRKDEFLDIHFEGGQMTGYGVSPARYSTTDPFIQSQIENSVWYKKKKIFRIK